MLLQTVDGSVAHHRLLVQFIRNPRSHQIFVENSRYRQSTGQDRNGSWQVAVTGLSLAYLNANRGLPRGLPHKR